MVKLLNIARGVLGILGLESLQIQAPLLVGDADSTSGRIHVAIIGAGAAGASSAYHLEKYLGDNVDIHIFEKSDYIGGRTKIMQIEDYTVELGASIFVEANVILREAVKEFNLSVRDTTSQFKNGSSQDEIEFAIWDGTQFQFELSNSNPVSQAWQFARKFGVMSPYRTSKLTKKVVAQFIDMYNDENQTFTNFFEPFEYADLTQYLGPTGTDLFDSYGINKDYQELFIQALTRVNYAQSLHIVTALAALVSLAATSGVYAVNGGNYQIFQKMIEKSGASLHLGTPVDSLKLDKTGKWTVNNAGTEFDYVVLAGPYQFFNISVNIPPGEVFHEPAAVDYVHLYTHYVLTEKPLNSSVTLGSVKSYENIISIPSRNGSHEESTLWTSIAHQAITNQSHHIYKVFSREKLNRAQLDLLFGNPGIIDFWVKNWFSYPEMIPVAANPGEVELCRHLLYTGGMDPLISTMETNALSGRNAARLIRKALLPS